ASKKTLEAILLFALLVISLLKVRLALYLGPWQLSQQFENILLVRRPDKRSKILLDQLRQRNPVLGGITLDLLDQCIVYGNIQSVFHIFPYYRNMRILYKYVHVLHE